MRKILVIETSATLRYILNKQLLTHQYDCDCFSDFAESLIHLQQPECYTQYAGIIVSWPNRTDTGTDELLTQLGDPPYNQIPLLIIAHEPDAAKLSWVASRNNTAFVLWDNHQDITDSLTKLLEQDEGLEGGPDHQKTVQLNHHPIKVLLVDDSPTARVKFRKLLEKQGYRTETASNVKEGYDKAVNQDFDIAIIDYFMPDDTGDVLCHKLRYNPSTSHMCTAILTSTYLDKVITTSLKAGAEECMFKNEADDLFIARVNAMSRTIQTTKRIETERHRLECILTSVGDGVYGINQQGLITFVNPAVRHILDFVDDSMLIGRRPEEVFHNKNLVYKESLAYLDYITQANEHGQQFHSIDSVYNRRDGTPIQVELTIFPMHTNKHEGVVVAFRDVSERKLLEEELRWQANHDPLTKLINRKYLEDALETEIHRLKRRKEKSALLYIDLDRFKYINDTVGHSAGDRVLIELGKQLQTRLRKSDILARFGGDEFVILLHSVEERALYDTADTFREIIDKYHFQWEGRSYKVNASIGGSIIDSSTQSSGEVLANADIACHIAKGNGRNATHIYSQDQDDKVAMDIELGWSNRLHHALDNDNFHLVFQPIIPLADIDPASLPHKQGDLWQAYLNEKAPDGVMYEVLLRLRSSNGSLIAPNAFLPTAERFNMMQDIDGWVIENSFRCLKDYITDGHQARFTINLSGQSLDSPKLIDTIKDNFDKYDIDPNLILFEITEGTAINKLDSAKQIINELGKLGCKFALDDFGSGYCSFSHLKHLPVDFIKIDGQFVMDFIKDPMDRAIVHSINNIAHSLGKKTIAEFVENADTLRHLKESGIDYIQGFYLSHPLETLPGKKTHCRSIHKKSS